MVKVLSIFVMLCCSFACFAEEEQAAVPYLVVLYGAPGSGRASMAVRLRKDFDFPNISLATLLANHVLEGTTLGNKGQDYFVRGGDLPPELLPAILSERLLEADCSRGAFLEDMSLSVSQIKALQMQLTHRFQVLAINIDASDEWLVQRVGHRFVCYGCGYVCDDSDSNRADSNRCIICSSPMQRRQGDTPEVVRSRVEGYRSQTAPLLSFYREQGVFVQISGDRKFEETYKDLLETIEQRTGIVASKEHFELSLQPIE